MLIHKVYSCTKRNIPISTSYRSVYLMNYNFGIKLLEITKTRCMCLDLS